MFTLHQVMKLNAISCITFGLIFLVIPTRVIGFLGNDTPMPSLLLTILGGALILNGLHIFWEARKEIPSKPLVIYFSTGDFMWVLGSGILLLSGTWVTNPAGVISTVIVAVMVGVFGVLQMIKRKELGKCD